MSPSERSRLPRALATVAALLTVSMAMGCSTATPPVGTSSTGTGTDSGGAGSTSASTSATGGASAGTSATGGSGSGGSTAGGASSSGSTTGPAGPYVLTPFANQKISSQGSDPNFQHADAAVDFHDGPFASVTMVVDLVSPCYPFSNWTTDPPPNGQNWPADCDAFDRNFEFSLDDPGPDGGPPGLEVERAITPFGGPEHLVVDLTDVANGLPGAHQLTVRIPTYSDGQGLVSGSNGSWSVNATITATPGVAPRHVLAVSSLYYGAINFETASQTAAFTAPSGTTYGWIEYRVTGHGQGYSSPPLWPHCNGPAEEFCTSVEHVLTVDGTPLATLVPFRDDCADNCTLMNFPSGFASGQYCLQNPCGEIQSVEAPRANWCPGTETPPFVLDGGALTQPGAHTLAWQVEGVDDGGGIWQTSVTYFAFGQ